MPITPPTLATSRPSSIDHAIPVQNYTNNQTENPRLEIAAGVTAGSIMISVVAGLLSWHGVSLASRCEAAGGYLYENYNDYGWSCDAWEGTVNDYKKFGLWSGVVFGLSLLSACAAASCARRYERLAEAPRELQTEMIRLPQGTDRRPAEIDIEAANDSTPLLTPLLDAADRSVSPARSLSHSSIREHSGS